MSDSESSGLSSPPATDDELPPPISVKPVKTTKGKISAFFKARPRSPSRSPEPERPPSPPHDYVLADNPDISVLIMFRNRFAEVFPRCPNIGPQDIENGIVGDQPNDQVEGLLCALLGLVLNRKKDVEKGHYGRALEDAISTHKSQWPLSWKGSNPLSGANTFNTMPPLKRLNLLRTLVHWSLTSSEAISGTMKESYKQSRQEDDVNQPLSVQPWGTDDKKRRYWLIEGHNDTPFRIFRSNAKTEQKEHWYSVCGEIDEARELSSKIQTENKTQSATRFAKAILNAIPRFEETRQKRLRKEYRQNRKAAFSRPESGISLYEGRTRGKRARYTFDDEDDYGSETSVRKSLRNTSGTATPMDGPTVTASGRQVRSRFGKSYGDPLRNSSEGRSSEGPDGTRRSTRMRGTISRAHDLGDGGSMDELANDDDPSDDGWSGDDEDPTGRYDDADEDDDEMSLDGDEDDDLGESRSKIVILKYPKGSKSTPVPGAKSTVPKQEESGGDTIIMETSEEIASNGQQKLRMETLPFSTPRPKQPSPNASSGHLKGPPPPAAPLADIINNVSEQEPNLQDDVKSSRPLSDAVASTSLTPLSTAAPLPPMSSVLNGLATQNGIREDANTAQRPSPQASAGASQATPIVDAAATQDSHPTHQVLYDAHDQHARHQQVSQHIYQPVQSNGYYQRGSNAW